jgi:hypothetical protein
VARPSFAANKGDTMPVTDESLERWATGDDIRNAHHAPIL